jgi:hypothetical protein
MNTSYSARTEFYSPVKGVVLSAWYSKNRNTRLSVELTEDEQDAVGPYPDRPGEGASKEEMAAWSRALDGRSKVEVRMMRKKLVGILRELGLGYVKVRWSWKAGCSCGCSPAFIANQMLETDQFPEELGLPRLHTVTDVWFKA